MAEKSHWQLCRNCYSVISNVFLPQHQQSSKKKVPQAVHCAAALAQIEEKVTAPSSHGHLLPLSTSQGGPLEIFIVQNKPVLCGYTRHFIALAQIHCADTLVKTRAKGTKQCTWTLLHLDPFCSDKTQLEATKGCVKETFLSDHSEATLSVTLVLPKLALRSLCIYTCHSHTVRLGFP